MKVYKLIILVILLFATIPFAKGQSEIPIQNISTDNNAIYRLFSTQNIYTFIKLNTRNGKMWQVQWSMESKYRGEVILSDEGSRVVTMVVPTNEELAIARETCRLVQK